jgi:hypothetical protein
MPVGGGCGHGFGLQVPAWVQVSVQAACGVTVQVPVEAQHAPVGGCGHGFGVQTPAWVQIPVQGVCVVTVQVPAAAQHAPVGVGCGHGFGVQTSAWVQVPVQAAFVVTVQVPAAAQHAPVGGGVVGSSPPHPAETITAITARVTSLRMVSPPSSSPVIVPVVFRR